MSKSMLKWGEKVKISDVINESKTIRNRLLGDNELAVYIDKCRDRIPVPKVGNGEIKLIFIGQDPTVKNETSRDLINVVLNLDRQNSLYRYLEDIANKLGCSIEQNVYATNLLKCFFVAPPATIKGAVSRYTPYWIDLLNEELAYYPNALVITLGEPVLNALIKNGSKKVRKYWGYIGNNQANINNFNYCDANNNLLQRKIFPFPHQPSIRKQFYSSYLDAYIHFTNNYKP